MKKNVMMRVASLLMVCVLATTCGISGTFAKYITMDDGSDSARVAKWGVVASVDGTLFYDAYQDTKATWTANEDVATITVQAKTEGEKVVAPGTKNEEGITIVLGGAPEVDVKVTFTFEAASEIMLSKNTPYTDFTKPTGVDGTGKPVYGNTFTLTDDYYPVVFTLTKDSAVVASGNVADIQTYLATLNTTYHTNTGMSAINGKYVLTWAWDFGTVTPGAVDDVDRADTYLGNEDPLQEIDVTLTVIVEQVD